MYIDDAEKFWEITPPFDNFDLDLKTAFNWCTERGIRVGWNSFGSAIYLFRAIDMLRFQDEFLNPIQLRRGNRWVTRFIDEMFRHREILSIGDCLAETDPVE